MNHDDGQYVRVLAELLRIQRWAGGETVSADRIFGLLHGFESVLRRETESFGIDEDTQNKVEDLLEEVEARTQSPDGPAIKERLRRDGVDETAAYRIMQLCRLQSRFLEGIRLIASGRGCAFPGLNHPEHLTNGWRGALHYMELVDSTEGVHKKLHGVFAPAIPRVGEFVTPQGGSKMMVVAIEHQAITEAASEGCGQACLVPYVILQAIEEEQ